MWQSERIHYILMFCAWNDIVGSSTVSSAPQICIYLLVSTYLIPFTSVLNIDIFSRSYLVKGRPILFSLLVSYKATCLPSLVSSVSVRTSHRTAWAYYEEQARRCS
jgi:hypothetical protein